MNQSSRRPAVWIHLFSALHDETISPAELAELNELLHTDPAARRGYLEFMDQQAALRRLLLTGESVPSAPASAATSASPSGLGWLNRLPAYSYVTAATVLFCGLTLLALWRISPEEQGRRAESTAFASHPPQTATSQTADFPPSVAQVGRTIEAQWASSPRSAGAPRQLYAGQEVELLAGRVEFRFVSGAVAVVEGPARLRIDGENRCQLLHGTLHARIVSPHSAGFTVVTPQAAVIDLGTEFSLSVDGQGETTVAVIEGEVAVESVSDHREILGMGKTIAIDASGRLREISAPFARKAGERTLAMVGYRPQYAAQPRANFVGTVGHLIEIGDRPLRLTHLGAQDVHPSSGFAGSDGFVAESIRVGLWSEDGSRLVASAEVRGSDPLIGGWRYAVLPGEGVTLEAGRRYLIGARVGEGIEWFLDGGGQFVKNELPFQPQRQIKLLAARYLADAFGPPLAEGSAAPERWAPANAAFRVLTDPSPP